jgi:hypothetical protein
MKLILAGGMFTCGAMYLSEKLQTNPEIAIPVTGIFIIGYICILAHDLWSSRK